MMVNKQTIIYRYFLTWLGLAGFAMALTWLYLGMRAVMDVGGFCAEGGAYAIEVHCPQGVAWKMPLSILGLFVFGIIYILYLVPQAFNFTYLFWSALFGSLGWNFTEYTVRSFQAGEGSVGWLICAVVFMLMAIGPLLLAGTQEVRREIFSQWKDGGIFSKRQLLLIIFQLVAVGIGIWLGSLTF